jgi:hypothetical protein
VKIGAFSNRRAACPEPLKFIGRMAKSRVKEVAERDKAKAVASKNH